MLLNKHNLDIAELAPKDSSRYILQALQVRQDRTAVTNGHYAIMVSTPTEFKDENFPSIAGFTPTNGSTPDFLLSPDAAKAISKAIPRKTTAPILMNASIGVNSEGATAVGVTDIDTPQVFTVKPVTGNFPNIEASMPTGDPCITIGLDVDYLVSLARSAQKFGAETLTLKLYDPQRPITMEAQDSYTGQKWFAALMSKRI